MLDIHYLFEEIRKCRKKERRLLESIMLRQRHLSVMVTGNPLLGQEEYELAVEEKELQKVQYDIDQFYRYAMYISLMDIDYFYPVSFYQHFSKIYKIGAFLLHSSGKSGQSYREYSIRVLLRRLISAIPHSTETSLMIADFASLVVDKNGDSLWRRLAARLNLGKIEQGEIIKKAGEKLESENIILVLHGVDKLNQEQLGTLLCKFWVPLASSLHVQRPKKYQLLMFLVDYSGHVKEWEISCIEQPDLEIWRAGIPITFPDGKIWQPDTPIRLFITTNFTDRDLEGWIERYAIHLFDFLPDELRHGSIERRVQLLLDKSNNGDPELVMSSICDLCESFLEGMEECLKL